MTLYEKQPTQLTKTINVIYIEHEHPNNDWLKRAE